MCTDLDLGYGLTDRWVANAALVGDGQPRSVPWRRRHGRHSTVSVHRVWQHRHLGEDAFYSVRNLYVDPTKKIRESREHTGGPDLAIQAGALTVSCRRTRAWRRAPAPLSLRSIRRGLRWRPFPPDAPTSDVSMLFVTRDGHANIFHSMADVLHAFMMLKMCPYDQIVFLDDSEDGPLMPLWSLLSDRPVRRFHELKRRAVISRAVFSPPGGCCFLWKNFHKARDECREISPILQGFRRWALGHLGIVARPRDTPRVTLIRRRMRFQGAKATRQITNEDELVSAIEAIGDARVERVDFAEQSLEEQMRTVVDSDVLVGMHGAGMTNLMWLEPGRGTIELFPTQVVINPPATAISRPGAESATVVGMAETKRLQPNQGTESSKSRWTRRRLRRW